MSADRSVQSAPEFALELVVPDLDLPAPRAPRAPAPVETASAYEAFPFEREIELDFAVSLPRQILQTPSVAPIAEALPPVEARPLADLEPMAPPTTSRRILEPLAMIPRAVWKRVAAYGFLLMILGNACCCMRLGMASTIALGVVVLVGLAGVVATEPPLPPA